MANKFNALSPDGFPISREPFDSQKDAAAAIAKWCEQYQEQGHYTTAERERIPLKELPNRVQIVSAPEMPGQEATLDAKFKKLGHHIRMGWEKQEIDTTKNLATAKAAVREQWEKERELAKAEPAPEATEPEPGKDMEPPEPERD